MSMCAYPSIVLGGVIAHHVADKKVRGFAIEVGAFG